MEIHMGLAGIRCKTPEEYTGRIYRKNKKTEGL